MAVTTRVLELYHNNHLRCPHLAIQPFVKSLCDLHGKAFRPYLSQQFSICYDLYIQLRDEAKLRVDIALGRDTPQWRLRNVCPACTYKLEGESKLIFDMLCTMDGNDSLKRILRREPATLTDGDEAPQVGASRESPDSRKVGGDYYLTRERVDRWAKAALEQLLLVDEDGEGTPCEMRWQNMINEVAARMWGIFDETGVFLSLCWHGFVLIIADMVRSGELYAFYLTFFGQQCSCIFLGPNILWQLLRRCWMLLDPTLVVATTLDASSVSPSLAANLALMLKSFTIKHLSDCSTAMLTIDCAG
jgi:hypothetical protein